MKSLRDDSDIGSLPYAGRDPCIYWGKRKFGVRVYKTGAKTFVLAYTDDNGKKRLLTLGRYPDISRESAEDLAGAYRLEIKDGRNPVEERRAVALSDTSETHRISRTTTVRSLCVSYLSLHASKKRSGKSDKRLLERFVIPAWGNREAEVIGPMQGAMLHMQVSKKTPGQANRLIAVIRKMWKLAVIWEFVSEHHRNPAYGVEMNKETSRERFINANELPQLIAAIEEETDVRIRSVLWLYLLTGARKSELLEAKWVDVDLVRRELRIPKPKQGKPHIYPLTDHAIKVLEQLPRFADNPFLIPGDKNAEHFVNISKPWERVRKRARLDDVWLHDLRRSVGSWLALSGYSLPVIGKVLGHSSPRTTQIYARLTDDVARAALEGHSKKIAEVLRTNNT